MCESARACVRTIATFCTIKAIASTVWPSGLRRWLKAPVRKGVGSNPTAVISQRFHLILSAYSHQYILHIHKQKLQFCILRDCGFWVNQPIMQPAKIIVHMTASKPNSTVSTVWPSGLRRWTQVPLSSDAWVRTPQLSLVGGNTYQHIYSQHFFLFQ